jgi:nitrate/nitrite-specific signal transduction histidine kinase
MQQRSEVVRSVVHVLCQRLRASMRNLLEDFTYIQQLNLVIEAAIAVEAGTFRPERLDEVARRTDELGQLARVFQHMAREIAMRERQLKQQVQELRIEVNTSNKNRQVAEITETDYFQELQQKVKELRRRNKQGRQRSD